ncbi:BZ3500_MvSof-1268-A1-R1_Chr3-3g06595 [Microbotryum saponariae]|uniref:BZ3500_MvSof-1268-A1-R1_Chr3-3g06595 protein n=1 Tax=Microbotryum saponariae TaxID=289078 RepID=A0A2X0NAT4_9BASI|nr:BZ3500_MvSof-1268-A1-R1_Chr3-3g06595 [Microbotryum saponariae]SDA04562.1 BZ3501_MvSof-1269-A2-R1_Chr3-2g06282 [Microbotryum saponariae]
MTSPQSAGKGSAHADVGGAQPPGSPPAGGAVAQEHFGSPTSTTSSAASRRSDGSTKASTTSSTGSLKGWPTESPIPSPSSSPPKPLAYSFAARRPWVLRTWMFPSSSEDNTGFRGHEIKWPPLEDFFFDPDVDARAARLGESESTITKPAPGITWHSGEPVWEPQGRLVKTALRQESDLYDPAELPDFVVLSRQSFGANPELAAAWAHDHIDDGADVLRDWEQVAAVGVLGGMKKSDDTSEYECVFPATRLKHHLRMLAAESPIRSHTFGFTLDGSILTLYLHTPSGLFYSSDIECTEANGHLSTFIERLLSLNDIDLGKIASPGGPDGPPLPFPTAVLPPRVPSFARHLAKVPTMGSIEIEKTVFCSGEVLGLQKSASRVRAIRDEPGDNREYAMTVSFVEEARCNEHDQIRQMIASASPHEREGLTNFVDVHRQHFTLVPHFLKGDLDAEECAEKTGLKPRAMEVTFQERCFEPIWAVDSIEALTRAVLGAVKGLRSLYRMRILHRDVSPGNIMIGPDGEGVLIDYDLAILMDGPVGEAARMERVGTFAFRARYLLKASSRTPLQPWHQIESLVYVILFVVFNRPGGSGDLSGMPEDAKHVWKLWNQDPSLAFLCKEGLIGAPAHRQEFLKPYLEHWEDLPELVALVANHCGLGLPSAFTHGEAAEVSHLEAGWGSGELSHDQLVADLENFREKIVQKKQGKSLDHFKQGKDTSGQFATLCVNQAWRMRFVIESTEPLIRVPIGKRLKLGLRNLSRMRILRRDVSTVNIMVRPDGEDVSIDHDLAVFMDGLSGEEASAYRGVSPLIIPESLLLLQKGLWFLGVDR